MDVRFVCLEGGACVCVWLFFVFFFLFLFVLRGKTWEMSDLLLILLCLKNVSNFILGILIVIRWDGFASYYELQLSKTITFTHNRGNVLFTLCLTFAFACKSMAFLLVSQWEKTQFYYFVHVSVHVVLIY